MTNHSREHVKSEYEKRSTHFNEQAKALASKASKLGNLRLLTVVVGIGTAGYFYFTDFLEASLAAIILSAGIFIYLISKHQYFLNYRDYYQALAELNQEGLARTSGDWKEFQDHGGEYIEEEHPYAQDLDLFGQGSLFQWINSTETYVGRAYLRELLINPCTDKKEIQKRQEALQELSDKLEWRQNLAAEGRKVQIRQKNSSPSQRRGRENALLRDTANLTQWADKYRPLYNNPWLIIGVKLLPILTVISIIFSVITQLPYLIPAMLVGIQIAILVYDYSDRVSDFNTVTHFSDNMTSYQNMIEHIELQNFQTPLLLELQNNLNADTNNEGTGTKASEQLRQLDKIVDAISHRFGQFYIVANILFLLDYRWQISLEKWKQQSGHNLQNWFEILGYIEALSSLANLSFEQPDWTVPEILTETGEFQSKSLGHPLLTDNRVCNDVEIKPPVNTLLITGSNMSGKSTLLRTAGLNLVLAYIGAPVCASHFKASLMKVYSCMRISDNLERNISSFYAELMRIEKIVRTAEQQPVFYLLDEIFKGTNSHDRHAGARAVIKKIQSEGSIGLVSTHDLELGNLEEESPNLQNYHFREYYQNGEIKFDYILRPGIAPTTNAIYLMELAGIKTEE